MPTSSSLSWSIRRPFLLMTHKLSQSLSSMRLTVRSKIMALTGLLLTLILLTVIILVSRNLRQVIEEETRQRGMAIAQLFGATNRERLMSYAFWPVRQNAQLAKAENGLDYVIVYNKEGLVAADTNDVSTNNERSKDPETLQLLKLTAPLFRKIQVASKGSRQGLREVYEVVLPLLSAGSPNVWAVVRIGISTENMHRHVRRTQMDILQIGAVCLVLGLVGSALLAAKITTPLVQLKEGSLRAAEGDLSSRIVVKSGDELESLADNFNFMMDQIKEHQDERIRTEKMAAVGHMVNTIVHDCRTPITVIKGFASLMREFELSPEKGQECLDFINFEVERMERMLEEILQFAIQKKITLVLREEVFDSLVRECCTEIEVLLRHTQIQFFSELNCDCAVIIDKDKLRRAILNIAANAREALKGSGEIRLVTEQQNGYAVVRVSDNGSGIPAAIRQKIFDPFFTHGKSMGFGLGMSITKKIVDDHFGLILLDSEVGQGTTFSIHIPLGGQAASVSSTARLGDEQPA
jgi:signal transduction histidine kinase